MTVHIATVESIKHWKDMVERMKWLMESGFAYVEPLPFLRCTFQDELFYILGTSWLYDSCALCCHIGMGCTECPLAMIGLKCTEKSSPWRLTVNAFSLAKFIENAEKYMIPALNRAKKWCEANA